jgi:hypothetical protein
LRAVKFDEKYNKAHTDLIRHHGMSPVAASAELHHVYRTWNPHAAELCISIELLLSVNGTLYEVKLDGKCDEAHNDLIRHHGMSTVTTRPELCHVLSQLGHCFEAIFQLNRAAFYA